MILDIVPNHMATDERNRYWTDPELKAKFFDIDEATGQHRRFFDIDHLAGVRQEDPEVFEETHRLAIALVRDGLVDGLRIDHPDGMADPPGYLRLLADAGVEHVWVEKILDAGAGESLRDWPVEGTVGYEFLNDVQGLFVDPAGEDELTALWTSVSGDERPFSAYAAEAKLEQATTTFRPEVERLERIEHVDDVEAKLAALPIYRTYDGGASEEDAEALRDAGYPDLYEGRSPAWVTRFQQTTPPVMAKGVEDTAFYRYLRLLALNDVGGDPGRFGISVAQFHAGNLERARRFPNNLLITQTHDTKRSGDVRARIGALAGMAAEWRAQVERWRELNRELRDGDAPDAVEEYLIYQTIVGAWPLEPERLDGYLEKALREGKRNTTWVDQNTDWEDAVKAFGRRVMEHGPFLDAFLPFAERVAAAGHESAMAQTLLKLTVPGVPDIYQGDELVALSLVDPDNRREVDWERRRQVLERGEESRDGEKLRLIVDLLALRKSRPEAFAGAYEPVDVGPDVCAFVRGGQVLVVAVLREAGLDEQVAVPWSRPVRVGDLTEGRSFGWLAR